MRLSQQLTEARKRWPRVFPVDNSADIAVPLLDADYKVATLTARIIELEAEVERLRAAVTTYVELNESKWEDVDEDHIGHNLGQRFRVAETALYDILDASHSPHPSRSEDGGA